MRGLLTLFVSSEACLPIPAPLHKFSCGLQWLLMGESNHYETLMRTSHQTSKAITTPQTVLQDCGWCWFCPSERPCSDLWLFSKELVSANSPNHPKIIYETSSFYQVSSLGSRSHSLVLSSPSCFAQGYHCKSKPFQRHCSSIHTYLQHLCSFYVLFLLYDVYQSNHI